MGFVPVSETHRTYEVVEGVRPIRLRESSHINGMIIPFIGSAR